MKTDRFRRGGDQGGGLTLTPLLDMFTIILIFLIVSFQAEDKGFDPSKRVELPKSGAKATLKTAVNVSIATDQLTLEGRETVSLSDGRFKQEFYDKERIPPLVKRLETYYKAIQTGETEADIEVPDTDNPILLVQADRKLEYKTLYLVLRSAGIAGFTKYRLAIQKSGGN